MLEEDEGNLLTTMKEVEEILATQKDGMMDTAVIIKMPLSPMTIATAIIITMKIQCTHLTPILKWEEVEASDHLKEDSMTMSMSV